MSKWIGGLLAVAVMMAGALALAPESVLGHGDTEPSTSLARANNVVGEDGNHGAVTHRTIDMAGHGYIRDDAGGFYVGGLRYHRVSEAYLADGPLDRSEPTATPPSRPDCSQGVGDWYLVDGAWTQDAEFGDGTRIVCLFVGGSNPYEYRFD